MGHQGDPRDPRSRGLGPCGLEHTPEKSYRGNQWCVWLNCDVCALRLHYAPTVGAPQSSLGLGPTAAHVEEMLSRLPTNKSEINGKLVRGLLKIVQGEAQVRSSHSGGKNCPGATTKEKASAASSGQGVAGANVRSTNQASASNTGSTGFQTSAATDRWEILVRRLDRFHTKVG